MNCTSKLFYQIEQEEEKIKIPEQSMWVNDNLLLTLKTGPPFCLILLHLKLLDLIDPSNRVILPNLIWFSFSLVIIYVNVIMLYLRLSREKLP